MNNLVRLILFPIFCPAILLGLGLTLLLEWLSDEPDYDFWWSYNKPIFSLIPFYKP